MAVTAANQFRSEHPTAVVHAREEGQGDLVSQDILPELGVNLHLIGSNLTGLDDTGSPDTKPAFAFAKKDDDVLLGCCFLLDGPLHRCLLECAQQRRADIGHFSRSRPEVSVKEPVILDGGCGLPEYLTDNLATRL